MKNKFLIIVLILVIIGFVCYLVFFQKETKPEEEKEIEQTEQTSEKTENELITLANPAAVYCLEQGGTLENIILAEGEDSYCFFADGSKCWQWDFFRGDCDQSQLQITILQEGAGPTVSFGETVSVHYTGTLLDGTKFDSSLDRGQPYSFTLGTGSVIQGWEQGILGMKVGEKRRLVIGPELAYGNNAVGEIIPAQATLIFEVELLN